MCEVTVTVELNGRKYQTNVIANKGTSDKFIKDVAKQQVLKQWNK